MALKPREPPLLASRWRRFAERWLSRLGGKEKPPAQRARASAEPLEPRVLYSADPFAEVFSWPANHEVQLQAEEASATAAALRQDARFAGAPAQGGELALLPSEQVSALPTTTSVVFIDSAVSHAERLVAAMPADLEVHWLHADDNGLAQMARVLEGRQGINTLHLISPSGAGQLQLGHTVVDATSMAGPQRATLERIGDSLASGASIKIYGADFAAGEAGDEALRTLNMLTGADVVAAADLSHSGLIETTWGYVPELGESTSNSGGPSTADSVLSLAKQVVYAAPLPVPASAVSHELIVVDSAVADVDALLDALMGQRDAMRQIEVLRLDASAGASSDAVAQITGFLASSNTRFDALRIISHGEAGALQLAGTRIDSLTLETEAAQLQTWRDQLSADADLLIYGCDVAAGDLGQAFIAKLADLTGADVAASVDLTGASALGGDWELEAATGLIEAAVGDSDDVLATWSGTLAIASNGTVTSGATAGGGATSLTFSHTVAAGTDRVLLVELAIDGLGVGVSGVTYGGVALTQAVRATGNHASEIWYLVAPTVGTANVVVSFGGTTPAAAGASTYNGVDQSAPIGATATASGTGTSGSVAIASNAGDLVVDAQIWNNNPTLTTGGSQTQLWQAAAGTSMRGVSTSEAGATSVTMSETSSSSQNWVIAAVSLQTSKASAVDDTAATTMNVAKVIDVTANDNNPQGASLTVLDLSNPANGTATASSGTITYTPTTSYTGTDSLSYRLTDNAEGLTHYWKLDGDGTDAIGGSTATLFNTPSTTTGRYGSALSFNESNEYATISDLAYGSNFTVSFDFNLSDNTGSLFQYLYSHGTASATNNVNVYLGEASSGFSNTLRTNVQDGNDSANYIDVDAASLGLIDGNWHTYTLTVSSTAGTRVYIDGVQEGSDSSMGRDGVNPTGSIYLAAKNDLDADRYYGGKLDSVGIYNSALSSAEVARREPTGSLVGTLDLRVAGAAPVNTVPGAQAVNEDTVGVSSSGNGNQISIADSDAGGSNNQVTVSVANGTFTLNGIAGLSFVAGDGTADATMTVRGTAAAINTALNGLSYTPTANWTGTDTLTVATKDAVLLSLDISANLLGRYAFENTGALGTDNSPAAGYAGTPTNATAYSDPTRGNVLSLAGTGYIQTTGHWGNPTNATLAAWVNLTSADSGGAEVISLGDSLALRLDEAGNGVQAFFYNGTTFQTLGTGRFLAGTGWHHVAYTFDDTNNLHKIYIDGVEVASAAAAGSVSYTLGANSRIGAHGNGSANYDFNGLIDAARVYNKVLTAAEIATLATDLNMQDADSFSITVNPVNDAPTITNGATATLTGTNEDTTSSSTTVNTILTSASWADVDSGALKGIAVTGVSASGTWYYSTDNTTWNSFGTVSAGSALLLDSGSYVRFVPNNANGETATFTFRAWDKTTGTASSNGTRQNADTSTNGGSTAYSTSTATASITVSFDQ